MTVTELPDVREFRKVFRGRYDDFAEQMEGGGYTRIGRPVTNADIQAHLDGDRTVGLYVIDPNDNTVWHTILDIDSHEREIIDRVAGAIKGLNLAQHTILESSGMKGVHFWLCYSEPIPAREARRLGNLIAQRAELEGQVEVFPKQDSVAEDGFGNLVKLPLGVHRKSGKRSAIISPKEWQAVYRLTPDQVRELLKRHAKPEVEHTTHAPTGEKNSSGLPCIAAMLEGVGEGCRDNVAYQLILHFRRVLDQDTAVAAMLEWDGRNKPPLGRETIEKKVKALWKSPAKGFGCDKDYMQQFCNAAVCPVHAKAHSEEIPKTNGALEDQQAFLQAAIPQYGWLWEYQDYASNSTDAPEVFHLFGGLSALSAIVGRKVYLPFGDGAIYPNTWIVLVAGSSFFHKSTALAIPARVVRSVAEDLLLPNEFSPEVLTANLSEQPEGLFVWSELKNALSMMERSYMAGTKELLTELYDCPDHYRRKLREKTYDIRFPSISILAASTVEWLVSSIKANDIGGGFTARFVFVPALAKRRDIALPEPTNVHLRNRIATFLHRCGETEGQADMTQVRRIYEEWYYKHIAELGESPMREQLSGFYSRLSVYTLKFAMLLEVSKTQDTLIQEETMYQAFAITDYLKRSISHLVEHEFHVNREAADLERLYKLIANKPGVDRRELLRLSHMAVKTFQPLLDTLLQSGRVIMQGKVIHAQ